MQQPKKVLFYSYASHDQMLQGKLSKFLKPLVREKNLEEWSYQQSMAGDDWSEKRKQALDHATFILTLLSPDYLDSDSCYQEMLDVLERQKRGEVMVIPVLLRPCDEPADLPRRLPSNGKAVTGWKRQEKALLHIVQEVRKIVETYPVQEDPQLPITPHPVVPRRPILIRVVLFLFLVLLLISGGIAGYQIWYDASPGCQEAISDDFTASRLHPGWEWIDPVGDSNYFLSEGSLKITAEGGRDMWGANFSAPRLLQPISGNFNIATTVHFAPTIEYQAAGIVIWQDQQHYLTLVHAYHPPNEIEFNAPAYPVKRIQLNLPDLPVTLQVRRKGNTFTAEWLRNGSLQGSKSITTTTLDHPKVGLVVATGNRGTQISAQFDSFIVTCI